MTRPSIIRADTIDLQDHQAPSTTQLHPKGRDFDLSLDDPRNHIAPHQAETLREVALESAEENLRSPRLVADSDGEAFTNQHSSNSTNLNGHSHNNGAYSNPTMDAYRQHEQDTLAAHDAGGSSSDEDPLDGDDAELDDDDLMDKISSSPSIEDEDIDFEFVYALHTFVATVEGQANATKGDTMVLLDDSNSYWWLVRVVKDSSIGYLPAEHIETPTERLARLNKHRNIDLSATMLGDQAPKQKPGFNLLRKKKTVVFTDPTYVDYSDFDYSTDEEDIEELFGAPAAAQQQQQRQLEEDESTEKEAEQATTEGSSLANSAQVEPLRSAKEPTITAVSNDTSDVDGAAKDELDGSQQPIATADGQDPAGEEDDEVLDDTVDGPSRSRNGTVRNTDSFFKDSSETKKITLTPNLLRDDSAASPPSESTVEARVANSFDKMDREMASEKDKRKSKDKKPSAIRNFFSRKDKKRTSEDDDESFGKRSMDIMSDPRDSEELSEQVLSPERSPHGTRQPSKLQKPQPRAEPSASRKVSVGPSQRATVELSSYLSEGRTNDVSSVPPASMRFTDPDTNESHEFASNDTQFTSPESTGRDRAGSTSKSASALSKIVPKRSPSGSEIKPQKTTKAKTRLDLESSDSEIEAEARDEASRSLEPVTEATTENVSTSSNGGLAAAGAAGVAGVMAAGAGVAALSTDKTSASGPSQGETIQASPSTGSIPPALVADTSSAEGRSPEASPSPEMSQPKDGSTTSSAREQWNDLKLKAFFEQNDHVHDLLAIVYDKTDNEQIGLDHPAAGSMFREQNAKLAEITTQLDNLLGDWLARKQRMRGTV